MISELVKILVRALASDGLDSNPTTYWVVLSKALLGEEETREPKLSVSERYDQDIAWIPHWYNHTENRMIQRTLETAFLMNILNRIYSKEKWNQQEVLVNFTD